MMPELLDVVIIGGGVVGCAIARELTRYRLRVCLLEKEADVGFGTSKANSGIIHGGHHSDPRTVKGGLEWEGNQLWVALAADLGFGFKRIGELTIALGEADLPVLENLLQRGRAKGVTGLEMWPAERVRAEEPNPRRTSSSRFTRQQRASSTRTKPASAWPKARSATALTCAPRPPSLA